MQSETAWKSGPGLAANPNSAQTEKSARHFWVGFIVLFLGLQVAGGATAIYLAVSDPTVAIIPNYYDAALNWDVTRRARELTQDLGWRIELSASPVLRSSSDERMVQVSVVSRSGKPVPNLMLTAQIYHHARGTEIFRLQFEEVASGVYQASTALTQAGLWQVDLRIEGDHGIAAQSSQLVVE